MAVIERIGRSETRPYVIAWGRLTEEDEHRLRARLAASPCAQITVDLREVEEVTDEGCAAIRNVAEDMDSLRQTMVVLYVPERDATRSLERTRLLDDSRIVFVASETARLKVDVGASRSTAVGLRTGAPRRPLVYHSVDRA